MSNDFMIKDQDFEGPLPLLLELIEKQKLDITKVSLADITDNYLLFVESKKDIGLAGLSEFLLIASQLILIKSKALLPLFEFSKEEEEEIEDLEGRLRDYQRFKNVGKDIDKLLRNKNFSFSRLEEKELRVEFVKHKMTANEIKILFEKVLQEVPTKEILTEEIMMDVVSIEEKITQLKESLEKRMKVAFQDTIKEANNKIEVVVTFLAMLEMVKQQIVTVKQRELFSEIVISKNP